MAHLVRINGVRGRWVAKVEGKWLGVLHNTQRLGLDRYEAPILPEHIGSKRLLDLEGALREHDLVVIQKDENETNLARNGYVGVFYFKDLIFDPDHGIRLTFTDRYASPK